jgi:predicted ATPase/DNA-binding winged helix-turn-helix (wHTH) protein
MDGAMVDPSAILEFGRFKVVRHRREFLADGHPIELGGRAFDTLVALLDARGTVLGKDELLSRVWPDRIVEENNLQAQISMLRKVLGADRRLIRTVAGRGYQFTGEVRSAPPAAAAAPSPPASNLPERVSDLIGRDAVLREVTDLVTAQRLVTLIGTGGIGKTRLGLEVARHLLPRFPDGVQVAELGPLSDPELVPVTVATALSLTLATDMVSPERIATALGTKHILLVLDNCEHVIEAAARMAEALLRFSPVSCVLATSREPLRAAGEYVYRVLPLDVPAEDNLDLDDMLRHGAVRLFVARAHAAEPRYVLDRRLASAMAGICRRLDGIPLAIELAAARVAAFGVEGVAARLDDRFRLLTGGNRTALPRHQTLRATLDWSYELLSENDRVLLRRFAVFAGGFTLESASAVAASIDIPASQVADGVANLVTKSLLSADVSGAIVHYRLLDTTRAYAREKLIASSELDQFTRRHAEYHRDLFDHAEAEWETRPTTEWVAVYGDRLADVRAALDWAFSPGGNAAIGVALTVAAVPLWMHLSLTEEWRERVERALASIPPGASQDARRDMRLFAALGPALLLTKGPCQEMSAAWSRALEIAENLNDADYQLRGLWGLFVHRFTNGDYRAAMAVAERFSRLAASTENPTDVLIGGRLIGNALHILGDQTGARQHLERAHERHVTQPYRSHTIRFLWDHRVVTRSFYARVLWLQGFADEAMQIAERSIDDVQAIDHPTSLFYALVQAACPVALLAGNLAAADRFVALLGDLAVRHARDTWNVWSQCFRGMLLLKRGDNVAAVQLLRSALIGVPETFFHMHYTPFLAELAEALGRAGEAAAGLVAIDQAIERSQRREERWCFPELLRKKGELLLLRGAPPLAAAAEEHFLQAIDWARRQDVLAWELRGATSLARLWHQQRRTSQARKLLAPVYRRFTEGFRTADLATAKALLATLR